MPVQEHRKVFNNLDAPIKVDQPLFTGPSTVRAVTQKKEMDVKSTTSKVSAENTKTVPVNKEPKTAPIVQKKRDIKQKAKKSSSSDSSSSFSDFSSSEENEKQMNYEYKGSSTRGNMVAVNKN